MLKNVELIPFASPQHLAQAAASRLLKLIAEQSRAGRSLSLALSGGRIAATFFDAVVEEARSRPVDWTRVLFFWSDERCVPPTDSASNFLLTWHHLLEPLGIQPKSIHRLKGELDTAIAAIAAAEDLTRSIERRSGEIPVLDLILLGLGEDGHVASLFPSENETARADARLFRSVVASKPPPARITMGYPLLAAASEVWILASGQGKEAALAGALRADGKSPCAQLLRNRLKTAIFTDIASAVPSTE